MMCSNLSYLKTVMAPGSKPQLRQIISLPLGYLLYSQILNPEKCLDGFRARVLPGSVRTRQFDSERHRNMQCSSLASQRKLKLLLSYVKIRSQTCIAALGFLISKQLMETLEILCLFSSSLWTSVCFHIPSLHIY